MALAGPPYRLSPLGRPGRAHRFLPLACDQTPPRAPTARGPVSGSWRDVLSGIGVGPALDLGAGVETGGGSPPRSYCRSPATSSSHMAPY